MEIRNIGYGGHSGDDWFVEKMEKLATRNWDDFAVSKVRLRSMTIC
jgi:hypothetical protein